MDLRQAQYVVAVVDEGSFTAAAASIPVSQPALSQAVAALERELGAPLFHRIGRRVVLTPAGEAFVEREGLRVLFLHAYLLGAVSLGLVSFGRARFGPAAWRGAGTFAVAVAVLVALLLPLTGLWPAGLAGFWALPAAALSSLGPVLLGAYALVSGRAAAR